MTTPEGTSGWIRCFHPKENSTVRLVCLPHAGGSASAYFPLSALADQSVEVIAVQYPGRQDRRDEPAIDDIQALARQAAEALTLWNDRPLALFGHSMGALVAYETALALEQSGAADVVRLFASGRGAPSVVREEKPLDTWPDHQVIAELRRLGGTDSQLLADDEVVRMMLPALRNDYRALRSYRCETGVRLGCPVTVLSGDADVTTSVEESAGWRRHTTGAFDQLVFSGGHFFVMDQLSAVLRAVSGALSSGMPSVP